MTGLGLEARGALRRLPRGARQALTVVIVGPGAVTLDRLDAAVRTDAPGGALVVGLGGGCAPGLTTGDLLLGNPVGTSGPAPEWRVPDGGLRARALAALAATGLPHREGRLLTTGGVIATPAEKAACWAAHGALGVDMESARVLAWAADARVPALAVRAVADGPDDLLPAALLGALAPGGGLRPGGVAAILRSPALIGAAWRMGSRSRRALGRLARFLQAFVDVPARP